MKKWLFILLTALMLAAALTLTACNGDDPSETDSDTTSDSVSDCTSDSESASDSGSASDTDSETESNTETESETEYDDPDLALDHLSIGGLDISNYTVVIPSNPAKYDAQAADFIIRFVKEATGVTLNKITDAETAAHEIVVGITNRDTEDMAARRAKIENDGYVMAVKDGNLYIQADIPRGTLFGVYEFLEDYVGVRMYGYDMTFQKESYEIKENLRVDIPADLSVDFNAAFIRRFTSWGLLRQSRETYPLWSCYNGQEVYFAMFSDNDTVGHTIAALGETGEGRGWQPCLSDEDIYQTVLKNVREWLAQDPNATYISVSQNDACEHGCQCEKCLAIEAEEGSASGPWIRFVNRIANDIKDDYPNVYVETFAYTFTADPPKVTKPADNVAIRLCSYTACNVHAIDDPDCPQNVEFMEQLKGWAAICDNLMVWTYTGNYRSEYDEAKIGPNLDVILRNARVFAENNVKSVFAQGKSSAGRISLELGELRAYLWGKAMWNPYMSEEEFEGYLNDFVNYYYGDAAPLLLQYLDGINQTAATKDDRMGWGSGHTDTGVDVDTFFHINGKDGKIYLEFFNEMKALWDQMEALDTLTDEQRIHVEAAGYHFWELCQTVYKDNVKLRIQYKNKCRSILGKLTPSGS